MVDGEQVQLRTAQRVLCQLGYHVVTVDSGEAALDVFLKSLDGEPFHLVILDMLMPRALNGLATLKVLRRHVPAQKALMASGYAPGQMSREVTENGVGWLPKPIPPRHWLVPCGWRWIAWLPASHPSDPHVFSMDLLRHVCPNAALGLSFPGIRAGATWFGQFPVPR